MSEKTSPKMMDLAIEIMRVTSERTDRGDIIVASLWRAIAGYYGRLCLDAGDPPELAGEALMLNAPQAARMAFDLVRKARALEEPKA